MLRNIINRFFNRIDRYRYCHLSLIKTFTFNIRCLPLKSAIKFPFFIYSNTQIVRIGKVEINSTLSKGMIKIGHHPAKAKSKTKIICGGKMIFNGICSIWGGTILEIHGCIEFGDKNYIAENNLFLCREKIKIGDNVSIGFNNILMDSSFHYILDIRKKIVFRETQPILIGNGCWITSDCKIMQGSILPDNSILVANSVLKSNYDNEEPCHLYEGNPAKSIRNNVRRILNREVEKELFFYFKSNPGKLYKKVSFDSEEDFCLNNFYT